MSNLGGGIALTPAGPGLAGAGAGTASNPNPLAQLLMAAGQFPQQQQAQAQTQLDTQQKQQQIASQKAALEQQQRAVAQQRYDALTNMVNRNHDLAGNPEVIQTLKDLSKTLGIPAPVSTDTPTPAKPIGPQSTAPTSTPAAGSPSGLTGMFGPSNAPTNPAGPGPALSDPGRGMPGLVGDPRAGMPATPTESVDLKAISPTASFDQLSSDPSFIQRGYMLTPEQRRAAYGNVPGVPEAFLSAPRFVTPAEKAEISRTVTTILSSANASPQSVADVLKAYAGPLSEAGIDPSSLITDEMRSRLQSVAQQKLQVQIDAGLLKGKALDERTRLDSARIENLGRQDTLADARTGLVGAQTSLAGANTGLAQTRQSDLIIKDQNAIRNTDSLIRSRSAAADAAIKRIQGAIDGRNAAGMRQTAAQGARDRQGLIEVMKSYQSSYDSLQAHGGLDAPNPYGKLGPDGQPLSMGDYLATQVTDVRNRISTLDTVTNAAKDPATLNGAYNSALGGNGRVTNVGGGAAPGLTPVTGPGGGPVQNARGQKLYRNSAGAYVLEDGTPVQ